MGINRAEERPENALIAEIKALRQEFNEYRANPQPIGNGSINYAVFTVETIGPFTIPAGYMAQFYRLYAPDGYPFTYDGKDALHKATLARIDWSVKVDVNDIDHVVPDGAAIAGPEGRVFRSAEIDYYGSNRSIDAGQMKVWYQLLNLDSASHTYWVTIQVLIPRPALKPQ